jgi:hypothetical protein
MGIFGYRTMKPGGFFTAGANVWLGKILPEFITYPGFITIL